MLEYLKGQSDEQLGKQIQYILNQLNPNKNGEEENEAEQEELENEDSGEPPEEQSYDYGELSLDNLEDMMIQYYSEEDDTSDAMANEENDENERDDS